MLSYEQKKKFHKKLDYFLGVVGFISVLFIIILIGFYLSSETVWMINIVTDFIILLFIIEEILRFFITSQKLKHLKTRIIDHIVALLLLLKLIFHNSFIDITSYVFPQANDYQVLTINLLLIYFILLFIVFIKSLRYNYLLSKIKIHPGGIITLSFAFIIIVGSILLMLPKATPDTVHFKYIDALFTSTSAVCVTGLTSVDTATSFTFLGKLIILFLIQVGGLGVMTLTTFFAAFLAGGISFKVRLMMKDLLSQESISEVANLLMKIALFTFVIEIIGALILYISLGGNFLFPDWNLIWISIFHSVSAFCNAGFSLFSDNLMNPLTYHNYLFTTTIMILIIFGGIGFTVLSNIVSLNPFSKQYKRIRYKLRLHTKLVLITTCLLILTGAFLIFITELYSGANYNIFESLYQSLFLSVTSRTAGFNIFPTEKLLAPTMFIIIILMWIGASPGSTGGGIKTSTISIAFLTFIKLIRGKERLELFNRQISEEIIKKSFIIIFASIIVLAIGVFFLLLFEPDKNSLDLIFEVTSALGTVGLSRGITSYLGDGGKTVIILTMFIGRIGALTFFMAFFRQQQESKYTLPYENIMIG